MNKNVVETGVLDRIEHVTICVANIESAVNWYSTSFRCDVVQQDPLSALIRFENTFLALTLPSQEPPHLAFKKHDAATYGELFEKRDGSKSTFISDPTGNFVELIGD